jgi:hypothetical protein
MIALYIGNHHIQNLYYCSLLCIAGQLDKPPQVKERDWQMGTQMGTLTGKDLLKAKN